MIFPAQLLSKSLRRWAGILIAVLPVLWLAGCSPAAKQNDGSATSQWRPTASVDAAPQWQQVCSGYAAAQHYHDDGRLIMRYRLNGEPREEHQLWAIDFDRSGQLAARLFNARIQADGERATVRVFDFDSENMDNQIVVLPPLDQDLWRRSWTIPFADIS